MARAESAKDYIERGLEAGRKRQFDQAIPYFNKALEIDPRNSVAYYLWGVSYFTKSNVVQAIADYTEALPSINTSSGYYFTVDIYLIAA